MIFGKKPIMSPELERQVLNTVAQYTKRKEWRKWGMHNLRVQGAAVLLQGPPGCGKTKIAEYLAIKIRRKGLKSLSFANFGSGDPGEQSRQIRTFFESAAENGYMTIFLDECEAVLWDRSKAGGDAMWMLEVIDALLTEIGMYQGLVILATNRPEMLDYALYRRLLAVIDVLPPEQPERIRLWYDKIPEIHPLKKMTPAQIEKVATVQLTGSEIETALIIYTSDCLRAGRKPTAAGLEEVAREIYERKQVAYLTSNA